MNSKIYQTLTWVMNFAYVQLLWVLFTLMGAVVAGLFPATNALFAIVRKWVSGEKDLPVFAYFWKVYKQEFMQSNKLGAAVLFLFVLVVLDIQFIAASETLNWLHIPLFVYILFVFIFLLFLFPSFAHFDDKLRNVFKNAFFIMLTHPGHLFFLTLSLFLLGVIFYMVPALGFIFGISATAFVATVVNKNIFRKIIKT